MINNVSIYGNDLRLKSNGILESIFGQAIIFWNKILKKAVKNNLDIAWNLQIAKPQSDSGWFLLESILVNDLLHFSINIEMNCHEWKLL